MEECLFCKISKGEIPSKTIYEDEKVKVFLDINPNTNGDLLIIPKTHYENITDIKEEVLTHMFKIIKEKIFPLVTEKLKATGLTIIQNNGTGQEIKHFHIHLTSRYEEDNLNITTDKSLLKELDEIHTTLMK